MGMLLLLLFLRLYLHISFWMYEISFGQYSKPTGNLDRQTSTCENILLLSTLQVIVVQLGSPKKKKWKDFSVDCGNKDGLIICLQFYCCDLYIAIIKSRLRISARTPCSVQSLSWERRRDWQGLAAHSVTGSSGNSWEPVRNNLVCRRRSTPVTAQKLVKKYTYIDNSWSWDSRNWRQCVVPIRNNRAGAVLGPLSRRGPPKWLPWGPGENCELRLGDPALPI